MNTLGRYLHLLLVKKRESMPDTLRLSVEGMHCGGCVRRVTAALERVKGVELGSVDVRSAQMTFNPDQTRAEEIAAAVNRIGFSARIEKA
jgi:copper chaperone